jgi:hypothetical protein
LISFGSPMITVLLQLFSESPSPFGRGVGERG